MRKRFIAYHPGYSIGGQVDVSWVGEPWPTIQADVIQAGVIDDSDGELERLTAELERDLRPPPESSEPTS